MMRGKKEERNWFVHWCEGQSRSAALLVGTALMFNILTHSSTQTRASSLWSTGVWLECTFTRFLTYPLKFNQIERLCSPKLHFSSFFNTVCCQMAFSICSCFPSSYSFQLSWHRHHEHTIILNAVGLTCLPYIMSAEGGLSTASAFLAILMNSAFFFFK